MKKTAAAFACLATVSLGILFTGVRAVRGADQALTGAPAIRYALAKLNVLGSVLLIGAHPDDENNGVLAWLASGRKIRTGYLSLTRGEGGQNLLGNEQGQDLGVLRTQELLAARRVDGASQYFSRAIDFGFTKTVSETMDKWGHDKILSDVIWVIRQQQPDVILLSFSGTPADGHGQHQVSAILGKEAFTAAADPSKFPEQLRWMRPWQAKRVMHAVFTPPAGVPGASGGSGGYRLAIGSVNLPIGDYDPVSGRSYREIAVLSRRQHKSQGMVQMMSFGAQSNELAMVGGQQPNNDLMDGIDTTWNRVPGGSRAGDLLARAQRDFDDLHPENSIPVLLDARAIVAELAKFGQQWAQWKLDEIDQAIALCAGLRTETQADSPAYVPGATAGLKFSAINRSHLPITPAGIHLSGWSGGKDTSADVSKRPLTYNQEVTVDLKMTVPKDRPWSQPFWLRKPPQGDTYDIEDQSLIGRADTVPEVTARFDFKLGDRAFSITEPLHYRYADPSRDEFVRPVVVEPPVSVILSSQNFVVQVGSVREVSVVVRAMVAGQAGELVFSAPKGWKVDPDKASFDLKDAGATQEATFRLTPPPTPGGGDFKVVADLANGPQVAATIDVIDYSHIPAQTVFETSGGRMSAVQMKVLARRVGYVMGSDDKMPEAIRQMGCRVDLLDDKALSTGDLNVYDAIVTGLRAYAVRADLRAAQQRLLRYVSTGGTLVVQYNRLDDRRIGPSVAEAFDHMGPYPFTMSLGNSERVTEEDTPVQILEPSSPIVRSPNAIEPADFKGWVQERGVYFADAWDPKYQTPFETHDAGDKPLKGGLLYTRYGKGVYIYTSFSWFRELPAGIPWAFRIFANLLSAAKVAATP
jgi:LmbE family N-acetylglucosaminyl deacetylase